MAARARASSFLGDERQDTRPPPHTSQLGGSCRSLRTCLSHMGPLHKGSGSHLHSFLSCMHQCIQSWHCGCDPARDHPFRSSGSMSTLPPRIVSIAWLIHGPNFCMTGLCVQSFMEIKAAGPLAAPSSSRSEEHTSELQSLMRISYAVFCLKKKKQI